MNLSFKQKTSKWRVELRVIVCLFFVCFSSAQVSAQRNVYLLYNVANEQITNSSPNSNLQKVNSLPSVAVGASFPVWRHENEQLYLALSPAFQYRGIEGVNAFSDLNQTSSGTIKERIFRGLIPVHLGYKFEFSDVVAVIGYTGFSLGLDVSANKEWSHCVQFLQYFDCFESSYDFQYGRDDIWHQVDFEIGPYPYPFRDVSKYRRFDLGFDFGLELVYREWGLKLHSRAALTPYGTSSKASVLYGGGVPNTKWYHRDFMFGLARYF